MELDRGSFLGTIRGWKRDRRRRDDDAHSTFECIDELFGVRLRCFRQVLLHLDRLPLIADVLRCSPKWLFSIISVGPKQGAGYCDLLNGTGLIDIFPTFTVFRQQVAIAQIQQRVALVNILRAWLGGRNFVHRFQHCSMEDAGKLHVVLTTGCFEGWKEVWT